MKKVLICSATLGALFSVGIAHAQTATPFPGTNVNVQAQGNQQTNLGNKPVTGAAGNINTNAELQANTGNQNTATPGAQANLNANVSAQVQTQVPASASCMAAAISKRDTKVIEALDVFHAQSRARIQTRIDEQSAAWTLSGDARVTANRTAWNNWRSDIREIRNTFRNSKTAVWNQYKADRTACGIRSSAEAGTGSMDVSL